MTTLMTSYHPLPPCATNHSSRARPALPSLRVPMTTGKNLLPSRPKTSFLKKMTSPTTTMTCLMLVCCINKSCKLKLNSKRFLNDNKMRLILVLYKCFSISLFLKNLFFLLTNFLNFLNCFYISKKYQNKYVQ